MQRPPHGDVPRIAMKKAHRLERIPARSLRPPPFAEEDCYPNDAPHRQTAPHAIENRRSRRERDRSPLVLPREENAERNGDDGGSRTHRCRAAIALANEELDGSIVPLDPLDGRVQDDAVAPVSGEPFRHPIVAVGDAELTLLLLVGRDPSIRERFRADQCRVGSVKALDERTRHRSRIRGPTPPRRILQELLEGSVGLSPIEMFRDRLELSPEIVESGEVPASRPPSLPFDRIQKQARLTSDLQQLGRAAVDELSTELNGMRQSRVAKGVDASADAVPGFEDAGANATLLQHAHRRQPRDARANNGDVGQ